ncbi:hypothetical protein BH11MYX3_BH11MYX3_17350 [soil metagenome]
MGLSIAFNGAFFAWPYQAGVAAFVQDRGLLDANSRIYGTSSGAVVAVMLACGVDIARVGLAAGMEANQRAIEPERSHPFFRPANVLQTYFSIFGATLPADAHRIATDRLFIRVTRVPRLQRILVSRFDSRQGLLDALGASIAIPGVTVTFAHKLEPHGWCLDGGPEVPDDDRPGIETVRVGVGPRIPRTKPDHIAPSRPVGFSQRFTILPQPKRRELFDLGYADARDYLLRSRAA